MANKNNVNEIYKVALERLDEIYKMIDYYSGIMGIHSFASDDITVVFDGDKFRGEMKDKNGKKVYFLAESEIEWKILPSKSYKISFFEETPVNNFKEAHYDEIGLKVSSNGEVTNLYENSFDKFDAEGSSFYKEATNSTSYLLCIKPIIEEVKNFKEKSKFRHNYRDEIAEGYDEKWHEEGPQNS